jgi:hypothetical protein
VILKDQVLEVRNVEGRLHSRKEPARLSGFWQRIREEHLDRVAIVRADKMPDGTLQTARISVGRAGVVPQ